MKINMFEKPADQSLQGDTPELWVQVLSSEVLDLPRIREAFSPEQFRTAKQYAPVPADSYHPWLTNEQRAEYGERFEDWFVFPKVTA